MAKESLKQFQQRIIDTEVRTNPGCCLFMTMGTGKTRTAIKLILKFKALRVLIVSKPKIVKDTWPNQLSLWGAVGYNYVCLSNLPGKKQIKILNEGVDEGTIVGTNFETFQAIAIKNRPKRVDLTNSPILQAYESVPWDVIIIDESTCIKDPTSKTALAMLNLCYNCGTAYVMSLTGTPNPEESLDFYTQVSVVDRGERFGQSFVKWRDKYFYPNPHGYGYIPFPFGEGGKTIKEVIADTCKDICYVLTEEEFAEISDKPARNQNIDVYYDLDDKTKEAYKAMKQSVLEMPECDVTAINAAIVINKLLQISSGFVYDNEREGKRKVFYFGLDKVMTCIDLIKKIGRKVIVCYNFQASVEVLETYLGLYGIEYAYAHEVSEAEFRDSKTIRVLLLQPASGAYGSNYQEDCHDMIWFEGTTSGEKFAQTEGRIDRTGQKYACNFYYLLGRGTYDKIARDKTFNKKATALSVLRAIKTAQTGEEYEPTQQKEKSPFEDKLLEDWYILDDMFS